MEKTFLYRETLYTVIVPFIRCTSQTNTLCVYVIKNYTPVVTMDDFSALPPLSVTEKGTLYEQILFERRKILSISKTLTLAQYNVSDTSVSDLVSNCLSTKGSYLVRLVYLKSDNGIKCTDVKWPSQPGYISRCTCLHLRLDLNNIQ